MAGEADRVQSHGAWQGLAKSWVTSECSGKPRKVSKQRNDLMWIQVAAVETERTAWGCTLEVKSVGLADGWVGRGNVRSLARDSAAWPEPLVRVVHLLRWKASGTGVNGEVPGVRGKGSRGCRGEGGRKSRTGVYIHGD